MATRAPQTLMTRAVAYLARREHSRLELGKKLARYLDEGQTFDEVESVLDRLESKGLLSDERYARSRARVRSMRYGDRRVAMELKTQGVESELVRETIEAIEEPEIVRATRLWERRFGEAPSDYKERARQIRFLASRGFRMSTVMTVINRSGSDDFEDIA